LNLTQEFEKNIKNLISTQKKGVDSCNKTLQHSIKELNKEMPKFKSGLETLQNLEDEKMSVGVDGVAKQRKSLLKSLRALGDYVRVAQQELTERFPDKEVVSLDEVKLWKYEDFKEWLRNFSKFVNNIDKQRQTTDSIMGLDFMLKKRPAYSPFEKIKSIRDTLRDLFQTDYSLIKIIEDLVIIINETKDLELKIDNKNNLITSLKEKIINNNVIAQKLREKIVILENEGELKKLRETKIKFQEFELEIGHLINPYKKAFRLYTRVPNSKQYIITTARSYEDNTIETFLLDSEEGFPQLKDLINEMILRADEIELKANLVNRCKQLLERIDGGKIKDLKDEYLSFKANLSKLSENQKVVAKLEELEGYKTEIDASNKENEKLTADLENEELNLKDLKNLVAERDKKFNELYNDGINFVFQKN
jgi:hypothetical protein